MTGGLVLAAGAGTRFAGGGPKLLAELDGRPVLEHVITAMCAVRELDRVLVVLGAHADEVLTGVAFGRAEPVRCPDWAEGMAASLRCGAAALTGADRVLVALGDAPGLTPEVVLRLLAAPAGARAVYRERPGHPVVLGRQHLRRLAEVQGDTGARRLLEEGPRVECGDLASGLDIDTVADLEEVRNAARASV
ncbi:MAG TPA: nucleotidyltransferase family protein [Solirubrobacteraceae bacterium]|nr:nucleotidyltransferase family protein [Solirubrobacteraceae bacterium]